MILFIHIPKTAGTSFRIGLERIFGCQRIIQDYGPDATETDDALLHLYHQKPFKPAYVAEIAFKCRASVVGGHFPVSRYIKVFPGATAISFVREPLQRCYSEYLHFKQYVGYGNSFESFFHQTSQINLQSGFGQK